MNSITGLVADADRQDHLMVAIRGGLGQCSPEPSHYHL